MFQLVAEKNQLRMTASEPMTSGSVKVYEVGFEFSDYWEGFSKVAVFATNTTRIDMALTEEDVCYVPWEVMVEPNVEVLCGVYGVRGDQVLPTIWASIGKILVGVLRGDAGIPDPTPGMYEQLQEQYAEVMEALKSKGDALRVEAVRALEQKKLQLMSGETVLSEVSYPTGGEGGGSTGVLSLELIDLELRLLEDGAVLSSVTLPEPGTTARDVFVGRTPVGSIVIWSGSETDIPEGWHLCDGLEGTPDLRGRFVLGASSTHAIDSTGGAEKVFLTVNQMPTHNHAVRVFNSSGTNSGRIPRNGDYDQSVGDGDYNTGAIQNEGGGQSHENMPPYYTLCYIQKIAADETDTPSYSFSEEFKMEEDIVYLTHPVTPITQEEYDAAPEADREGKVYLITDDDPPPIEGITLDAYQTDDGWYVRKWSDGYLELSYVRSVSFSVSEFTASGNIYVSPLSGIEAIAYPIPFVQIYSKTISPNQGVSGFWVMMPGTANTSPLVYADRYHIARQSAPAATASYSVSYYVTGRWK